MVVISFDTNGHRNACLILIIPYPHGKRHGLMKQNFIRIIKPIQEGTITGFLFLFLALFLSYLLACRLISTQADRLTGMNF